MRVSQGSPWMEQKRLSLSQYVGANTYVYVRTIHSCDWKLSDVITTKPDFPVFVTIRFIYWVCVCVSGATGNHM